MSSTLKNGSENINNRIHSLDFIRGTAILAMLISNIPWHVGTSMSRLHEADFFSVMAWLSQYLFFDSRFMPLFAMLFGASIFLLNGSDRVTPTFRNYFIKQMMLLLGIGVLHAYLIWPGDILISYAVFGSFLLLFYNSSTRKLLTVGILLIFIKQLFGQWPALYNETLDKLLFAWWVNYGDAPFTALQAYQGSYLDLLSYNAYRNQYIQWTGLISFRVWNALGFMLIGMALFKMGILQGQKSREFYWKMVKTSLLISVPLVIYGVFARIGVNPTVGEYLGFTHELPMQNITFRSGCAIMSLAVLGALHLIHLKINTDLRLSVEAVGRTALSNYLFHSVFFLSLTHGLDIITFDTLDHDTRFMIAAGVWVIQLVGSRLWLSKFKQGPIEAAWRYLCGKYEKT